MRIPVCQNWVRTPGYAEDRLEQQNVPATVTNRVNYVFSTVVCGWIHMVVTGNVSERS